jgi:hypothetical protein
MGGMAETLANEADNPKRRLEPQSKRVAGKPKK